MTYLQAELNQIVWQNISEAELMADFNLNYPQNQQVEFCSKVNITLFDEIVNDAITGFYVCIGIVSFIIFCMLMFRGFHVVQEHRNGEVWRPSWFQRGMTLDTFIGHIWHKPSMTCLLIGLLGIAIFKGLQIGTLKAKQSYIATVLIPIQNGTNSEINRVGDQMDLFSLNFANSINGQILQVQTVFFNLRDQVNATIGTVVNIQTTANDALQNSVGTVPDIGAELLQMIQCMAVILTIPLTDVYNLVPTVAGFPLVNDRVLTFNRTRVKGFVSTALNDTTYAFDWFYNRLEGELMFYYFLTAYGAPVFFIGLIFAAYDLYQYNIKKRQITATGPIFEGEEVRAFSMDIPGS